MSALEWYSHKSLGDSIFWIQERFFESCNRANIWLVHGTEQDVVIDTGLGLRSLPEYLYSAGLLQDPAKERTWCDGRSVHRAEADALAHGDNFETATWLSESEVVGASSPGWNARQFRVQAVQPIHIPQEGDVISLGDRQLTVMHMPGHSRGSLCLLDKDLKILFSGDVVYDGAKIDWLPYSQINDYIVTCERLIELVDSGVVEKVLPGHFDTFGAERLYRLASEAGLCHKVPTCAMRSLASLALPVTTSRTPS
uniref:Metallo-beta-lactamase domain-containing protein n=1 Tax=Monodelphis domestica TaxID=13616 RepID=F6YQ48_MONDO